MKLLNLLLFSILMLLTACGGNDSAATTEDAADSTTPTEESTPYSAQTDAPVSSALRYPWVINLNIRSAPNTGGEVVATAQPGDGLEVLETANKSEQIVLRGVLYDEAWVKVKTPDGKEGWVFGGAIKRPDEAKGNDPIEPTKFSFPVFGQYDLSQWRKVKEGLIDSEGDFDKEEAVYTNGGQTLTITSYDGEYGYGYIYELTGSDGKMLKKRRFSYSNDGHEMEETVADYTSSPPKEYSRRQTVQSSARQLNAKPMMVRGEWTQQVLSEDAAEANAPSRMGLLYDGSGRCAGLDPEDTGCSCSFRLSNDDYQSQVLSADYAGNACVNIDGQKQVLKGSWQTHRDLQDPWIKLTDERSTLFNDDAPFGDYEIMVELLTQALLTVDRIPDQVSIDNKQTGMFVREVRDMGSDAVAKARQLRKNGEKGSDAYFHFENDQYVLIIKASNDAASAGDTGVGYRGEITITTKDGTLVDRRTIWGSCGC